MELPPEIKVHLTSHISLQKPFREDTLWPNRKKVMWPRPDLVGCHLEYEVEGIVKCKNPKQKRKEHLVKWRGYHETETTCLGAKYMVNTKELVESLEETRARGSNKM